MSSFSTGSRSAPNHTLSQWPSQQQLYWLQGLLSCKRTMTRHAMPLCLIASCNMCSWHIQYSTWTIVFVFLKFIKNSLAVLKHCGCYLLGGLCDISLTQQSLAEERGIIVPHYHSIPRDDEFPCFPLVRAEDINALTSGHMVFPLHRVQKFWHHSCASPHCVKLLLGSHKKSWKF